MQTSQDRFSQVRLEVLVNGKRRAMLGVEPAEKLLATVAHGHVEALGDTRTILMMFNTRTGRSDNRWKRETILSGVGDDVTIRIVGPGPYESDPTKCFPVPEKRRPGETIRPANERVLENHEQFALVRLEVLVNGARYGSFGAESGGSVNVGVGLSHDSDGDAIRTDVWLFGTRSRSKHTEWRSELMPIGVGDEVTVRITGPGYCEALPGIPQPSEP